MYHQEAWRIDGQWLLCEVCLPGKQFMSSILTLVLKIYHYLRLYFLVCLLYGTSVMVLYSAKSHKYSA